MCVAIRRQQGLVAGGHGTSVYTGCATGGGHRPVFGFRPNTGGGRAPQMPVSFSPVHYLGRFGFGLIKESYYQDLLQQQLLVALTHRAASSPRLESARANGRRRRTVLRTA